MTALLHDPILMLAISLVIVVGSIVWLRTGAFFALLFGALSVSLWTRLTHGLAVDAESVVTTVGAALGTTAGKIGMLIVFGTTIGKCMTDNGSAERIVLACRRFFGEKRIPAALAGGAFILSIPVFYDATFYLLLPLAKSAYRSVRRNYVAYLLAVGLAATISHTVIPPTPGPIAVAQTLGVPLSTSLGIALMVGACLFPIALTLAWALNKRLPNPTLDPVVAAEIGETPASAELPACSSTASAALGVARANRRACCVHRVCVRPEGGARGRDAVRLAAGGSFPRGRERCAWRRRAPCVSDDALFTVSARGSV